MLNDPVYRERWNGKLQWYAGQGIADATDDSPAGGGPTVSWWSS
jgi:hypothetical protein